MGACHIEHCCGADRAVGLYVSEHHDVASNDFGHRPRMHTLLQLGVLQLAHTHTRIPGSLNRAKRRSRNRKVVGSIPGAGMSGGGRRQPCVKGILSGEIAK